MTTLESASASPRLSNVDDMNENNKPKSKWMFVIDELINTEHNFVDDMNTVLNGYKNQLSSLNSMNDLNEILSILDSLVLFNKTVLNSMIINSRNLIEVCNFLHSNKDKFSQHYRLFTSLYKKACDCLDNAMADSVNGPIIKKCQKDLNHALDLASYLLKPVQRIMKYHLMLQSMSSDKELDSETRNLLNDTAQEMSLIADLINEVRRNEEGYLRVPIIAAKVTNKEINVNFTGPVVLEETFKLTTKRNRFVVLCEKTLFIFKNIPEEKLSCKSELSLNNIVLFDNVNGINNAFEIQMYGSKKTSYILQAKTLETKKRWIIQIKRLLIQTMAIKLSSQNMEALFGSRDACSIQQALTVSTENQKVGSDSSIELKQATKKVQAKEFIEADKNLKSSESKIKRSPSPSLYYDIPVSTVDKTLRLINSNKEESLFNSMNEYATKNFDDANVEIRSDSYNFADSVRQKNEVKSILSQSVITSDISNIKTTKLSDSPTSVPNSLEDADDSIPWSVNFLNKATFLTKKFIDTSKKDKKPYSYQSPLLNKPTKDMIAHHDSINSTISSQSNSLSPGATDILTSFPENNTVNDSKEAKSIGIKNEKGEKNIVKDKLPPKTNWDNTTFLQGIKVFPELSSSNDNNDSFNIRKKATEQKQPPLTSKPFIKIPFVPVPSVSSSIIRESSSASAQEKSLSNNSISEFHLKEDSVITVDSDKKSSKIEEIKKKINP